MEVMNVVSEEIIASVAKVVAKKEKNEKKDDVIYGVVREVNGKKYISIDGSNGTLTPIAEANDAEDGDRVIASIKDRNVVVTGNLTFPASAKTATNYMVFDKEKNGLVVGRLDNGKPTGSYVLIKDDAYEIYEDNSLVSGFSKSEIFLGDTHTDVRLSNDFVFERNKFGRGIINHRNTNSIEFDTNGSDLNTISLNIHTENNYANVKQIIFNDYDGVVYSVPGEEATESAKFLTGFNSVVLREVQLTTVAISAGNSLFYTQPIPIIHGYSPISIVQISVNDPYWNEYSLNTYRLLDGQIQIWLVRTIDNNDTSLDRAPTLYVKLVYILSNENLFSPGSAG